MLRRSASLIAAAVILYAGEPARKPEDYPARIQLGKITLAVENLGPSIPTPSGGIFTKDYLAIEVALFGTGPGQHVSIEHAQFALRINGAAAMLRPDTPGAVAASVKYPDWEQRQSVEAHAGIGDADVILGRPRAVERFPGDRRPVEQQGPPPVRVENPVAKKGDSTPIGELVARAALPEGESALPVSGCLYFPFKGKLKSIKKLELVYEGPLGAGSARIP